MNCFVSQKPIHHHHHNHYLHSSIFFCIFVTITIIQSSSCFYFYFCLFCYFFILLPPASKQRISLQKQQPLKQALTVCLIITLSLADHQHIFTFNPTYPTPTPPLQELVGLKCRSVGGLLKNNTWCYGRSDLQSAVLTFYHPTKELFLLLLHPFLTSTAFSSLEISERKRDALPSHSLDTGYFLHAASLRSVSSTSSSPPPSLSLSSGVLVLRSGAQGNSAQSRLHPHSFSFYCRRCCW